MLTMLQTEETQQLKTSLYNHTALCNRHRVSEKDPFLFAHRLAKS